MKKTYEAPNVEVVKFQYRDQVVVASGGACTQHYEANREAIDPCYPTHWTGDNTRLNG